MNWRKFISLGFETISIRLYWIPRKENFPSYPNDKLYDRYLKNVWQLFHLTLFLAVYWMKRGEKMCSMTKSFIETSDAFPRNNLITDFIILLLLVIFLKFITCYIRVLLNILWLTAWLAICLHSCITSMPFSVIKKNVFVFINKIDLFTIFFFLLFQISTQRKKKNKFFVTWKRIKRILPEWCNWKMIREKLELEKSSNSAGKRNKFLMLSENQLMFLYHNKGFSMPVLYLFACSMYVLNILILPLYFQNWLQWHSCNISKGRIFLVN